MQLDDYDDYLMAFATQNTQGTPISAPAPISAQTPYTPYQSNIPTTPFSGMTLNTTSLMPNVKLDVKQYPLFHGENAQWPKFKRGVLSIASTHGLDDIFDQNTIVPLVGDSNYYAYQERNKFVYSIWISRIVSGLALSILRDFENSRDGRGVYLKLLDIYEGKSNLEQVALMAMTKLSNLQFTYNYPGGIPTFLSKFRDAQQDLRDANQPLSDTMTKSILLSKINDNNY